MAGTTKNRKSRIVAVPDFLGISSVTVTEKFYAQAGGKNAREKADRMAVVVSFQRVMNQ